MKERYERYVCPTCGGTIWTDYDWSDAIDPPGIVPHDTHKTLADCFGAMRDRIEELESTVRGLTSEREGGR